jgi:tight adherence protein C
MGGFIAKYLSIGLVSLAFFFAMLAIVKIVLRSKTREKEDWRDPPPLIYRIFKPIVRLFASDVREVMPVSMHQKIQTKLSSGGVNYAIMAEEFLLLKFLCMISMIIISYLMYTSSDAISTEFRIFLVALIPIGFFYPDIWLSDRISFRRKRVAKEFPFLVDLLVLSMRAGLNYSTSLGQAISNLPDGPVKEEFGKLLREVRAGKIRRDALNDLAHRMNIKSVSNFVSAINQAEETGGEIVDVLTIQAEQRRSERFNEAEEAANKAPIKMLLPLVVFLFPIIFLLVGFVVVVKLAETGYLPESIVLLLV